MISHMSAKRAVLERRSVRSNMPIEARSDVRVDMLVVEGMVLVVTAVTG